MFMLGPVDLNVKNVLTEGPQASISIISGHPDSHSLIRAHKDLHNGFIHEIEYATFECMKSSLDHFI